jgi:hypothetical protein
VSPEAVVDNDVLIKLAAYLLLGEVLALFGGSHVVGVLGAARYVVRHRLERHPAVEDKTLAQAHWVEALGGLEELEPTSDELTLATSMEEEASANGLPLDTGESQLCAITIVRAVPLMVTGDKRAIEAIEAVLESLAPLAALSKRVACLEQLMSALVRRLGAAATRDFVCAAPGVDKALSICFGCSAGQDAPFDPSGLVSYIAHLRTLAPTILVDKSRLA